MAPARTPLGVIVFGVVVAADGSGKISLEKVREEEGKGKH